MRNLIKKIEVAELIAGTAVLVCSFWIFSPADQVDISNSEVLSRLLPALAPGFLVFIGCYRQAVHRSAWGVAAVIAGAAWSFWILNDIYMVARLQLCLIVVAAVASIIHTLWDFLSLLTLRTSNR